MPRAMFARDCLRYFIRLRLRTLWCRWLTQCPECRFAQLCPLRCLVRLLDHHSDCAEHTGAEVPEPFPGCFAVVFLSARQISHVVFLQLVVSVHPPCDFPYRMFPVLCIAVLVPFTVVPLLPINTTFSGSSLAMKPCERARADPPWQCVDYCLRDCLV